MTEPISDNKQNEAYEKIWAQWTPENIRVQIDDHRQRRSVFLDILKRWVSDGGEENPKVLEMGCGTSIDLHILAEMVQGEYHGIDVSSEGIKRAQEVSQHFSRQARLEVQDGTKMTFGDGYFDVVFSQGVLEHFPNPEQAVAEQLRVLKPGGKFIISVPQAFTSYTVYKQILRTQNRWPWGYETQYSFLGMNRIARKHGLKILDRAAYDYWKHPLEMMWILRSLNQKRQKLIARGKIKLFDKFWDGYDCMFNGLEKCCGILFMKNIVYVYQKDGGQI